MHVLLILNKAYYPLVTLHQTPHNPDLGRNLMLGTTATEAH
jgi:hypothetical protein